MDRFGRGRVPRTQEDPRSRAPCPSRSVDGAARSVHFGPWRTAIRLRITEGDHKTVEHDVPGPVVVLGRAPECDVVLDHPYVSKRHLRIVGGIVVEDLGSSNGTYLDEVAIDAPEVLGQRKLTVGGPAITVEVLLASGAAEDPNIGEVELLRKRVQTLEAKLEEARRASSETGSRREPRAKDGAMPPLPAIAAGEFESVLLEDLVRDDFKEFTPRMDGSVTNFYILESFRLLRQVEKVVTRMAGELSKQLNLQTILPDNEGNFMALIAEVMVRPGDAQPRQDLLDYLDSLRKWLFVSLGAYQKASLRFAEEMRQSLSPLALAQKAPIPASYRVLGMSEVVLYRRARAFLDELSSNFVEDRLDELAKDAASELLGGGGRPRR